MHSTFPPMGHSVVTFAKQYRDDDLVSPVRKRRTSQWRRLV